MSEKPASLLTKTQRQRLADDFADVEGAKRRRDQRAIRRRVAAGLDDFEHLAEYPDDQLELALEEFDDEEVATTVARLYVVAERIRALRGIDAGAAIERAQSMEAGGEAVDLRTREQHREAIEASLAEELGPTPWKRRADALLKVGGFLLFPALALGIVRPDLADGPVGGIPGLVGAIAVLVGLAIVLVHALKNDVVPAARALAADPAGTLRGAWERI